MKKKKYKPAKGEPQTIGEWILLLIFIDESIFLFKLLVVGSNLSLL